ncbi:transient receptor potential cation channel subfamily M member 3 [Caerostris extrusa]|uniref:Transient receptor potential cation channel subfamily M member 3 n=1 Tax=Caerostris extrusa TaxID=172846 RepID=A0AAV4XM21_CAEEX|nr:transient receptor potential cation channel subfamily M member 3 [Caerostris extrusa]
MRDYLTVGLLRTLYNECICENEAAQVVLKDLTHKDKYFNLRDISNFLSFLMRKHRHDVYQRDITCKRGIESTGISGRALRAALQRAFYLGYHCFKDRIGIILFGTKLKSLCKCQLLQLPFTGDSICLMKMKKNQCTLTRKRNLKNSSWCIGGRM